MKSGLKTLTVALTAGASLLALTGDGMAQSDAELRREVQELRRELQELRDQMKSVQTQSGAMFAETVRRQDEQTTVKLDNGRPTIASADGNFTAQIRGRAQFDVAAYDQDPEGPIDTDHRRGSLGNNADSAAEASRARDLSSGANFRRAQIGIEGTFFKDIGYTLAYQFGGSGTEEGGKVQDVFIEYRGIKGWRFRAGAFAPPANMDDAVGSADTLFLERASSAEISRGLAGNEGRYGIGALGSGERWTASLVLTGGSVGVAALDEQLALVGRATGLVHDTEDTQLHVGGNVSYVFQPADNGVDSATRSPIRLRDRPEIRVDGTRLIDTGNIDATSALVPGVELALRYKGLVVQAEHFWYRIERRIPSAGPALPDPDFSGYYVQASYSLTGEPRRYSSATGAFGAPKPKKSVGGSGEKGGLGAWEVAARYSVVDLDYNAGVAGGAAPTGGIRGGRQETWTAGVNWYLNPVTRLSADYQHIDIDRLSPGGAAFGPGALTPPAGTQVGQSFNVFSLRSQLSF
jgi:phosphate-selective porin OprO/OprP